MEKTKLDWGAFSPKFGDWGTKIGPFFSSGGFDKIYAYLKEQSSKGKKVCPESKNTFRAFLETPLESLKVVMIGMAPYNSIIDGKIVADGLLMGCENTRIAQPSLQKFYEGLETELYGGLCLTCYWNPSVAYLARQGVLMYNSALTTEIGQPGAHQELWEAFTKMVICDIIVPTGAPVILLGKKLCPL